MASGVKVPQRSGHIHLQKIIKLKLTSKCTRQSAINIFSSSLELYRGSTELRSAQYMSRKLSWLNAACIRQLFENANIYYSSIFDEMDKWVNGQQVQIYLMLERGKWSATTNLFNV